MVGGLREHPVEEREDSVRSIEIDEDLCAQERRGEAPQGRVGHLLEEEVDTVEVCEGIRRLAVLSKEPRPLEEQLRGRGLELGDPRGDLLNVDVETIMSPSSSGQEERGADEEAGA